MSGDNALTHEQVRAVLVDLCEEYKQAAAQWEVKSKGSLKGGLTESGAKRFAALAAALSAAIDALEDSALLDLMERHMVGVDWIGVVARLIWEGKSAALYESQATHPNGWPTARDALRTVAAVLGKDGGER